MVNEYFSEKAITQLRRKESEGTYHVKMWEESVPNRGAANAKASRKGHMLGVLEEQRKDQRDWNIVIKVNGDRHKVRDVGRRPVCMGTRSSSAL